MFKIWLYVTFALATFALLYAMTASAQTCWDELSCAQQSVQLQRQMLQQQQLYSYRRETNRLMDNIARYTNSPRVVPYEEEEQSPQGYEGIQTRHFTFGK